MYPTRDPYWGCYTSKSAKELVSKSPNPPSAAAVALGRPVTCARVTPVTRARALACHLCPRMCLKSRQGHTLGHLSRKRGPVTCARLSVSMCGRTRDEVFVVSNVVSLPHLAASLPLPPVQPIPVDVVVMHWRHPMQG